MELPKPGEGKNWALVPSELGGREASGGGGSSWNGRIGPKLRQVQNKHSFGRKMIGKGKKQV